MASIGSKPGEAPFQFRLWSLKEERPVVGWRYGNCISLNRLFSVAFLFLRLAEKLSSKRTSLWCWGKQKQEEAIKSKWLPVILCQSRSPFPLFSNYPSCWETYGVFVSITASLVITVNKTVKVQLFNCLTNAEMLSASPVRSAGGCRDLSFLKRVTCALSDCEYIQSLVSPAVGTAACRS